VCDLCVIEDAAMIEEHLGINVVKKEDGSF
jgi:hypothetical protein